MNRRGFLLGALAAPAVIRSPGLLMPVKPLAPDHGIIRFGAPCFDPLAMAVDDAARFFMESLRKDLRKEFMLGEPCP